MSLEAWREAGLVVSHEATPEEIADLFAVAETDLRDAAISELSPERKLGCAYGAILSAGRAALHAAAYRVPKSNPGHHHYVIQSLRYTVGLAPSIVLLIFYSLRTEAASCWALARVARRPGIRIVLFL